MELIAMAVLALEEKFDVANRPRPSLLDDVHDQIRAALKRPETTISLGWLHPSSDERVLGPILLDFKDAARLLSCSERTVERLVKRGELQVVYIGRLPRIAREELDQYVQVLRDKPGTITTKAGS